MSLLPLQSPPLSEMMEIGPVTNLGSTIISGECIAYGKGTFGAPTDPVSAGYFAVTPGSFRMTYPFNEQAVVMSGQVKLTDVKTGQSRVYIVGESWFVTQGTEVIWEVQGDVFVKHYFAVVS